MRVVHLPLGLFLALLAPAAAAADALTLLRQGDLEAAAPLVRDEARAHPEDLARQERWIDLMLALGLPEPAFLAMKARVRQAPADPDAHYLLGRATPDAAGSIAAYEAALRLDPTHARSWMGLGAVHRARGELREAGEAYRRALLGDATLEEAWGGLLAVFLAAGDAARAAEVAREAAKATPTLAEAWLVLASQASTPTAVLQEGIVHAPWDARLHEALADALLVAGKADDALRSATRALVLDPRLRGARLTALTARDVSSGALDTSAVLRLVEARRAFGAAPDKARSLLDAVIAKHPRAVTPRLDRAHLVVAKAPEVARADLETARSLAPGDDEVAATLGLLLRAQGAPARAAPLLDQALATRPFDAKLALACAQAHAEAGAGEVALQRVREAVRRFPLSIELGLYGVLLQARLGDAEGAYQTAREVAARIPDPRAVLAAAAAAEEARRWADAADHYDEAARRTGKAELAARATKLRTSGGP